MRRLVYGLALLGLFSMLPGCRTMNGGSGGDSGGSGVAQVPSGQNYGMQSKVPIPGSVARGSGSGSGNGYGDGSGNGNGQAGPPGHHYRPPNGPTGPVPQYAYPYYTIRGPRDFLVDNPPSIGPY
jgi:hypothetical protein